MSEQFYDEPNDIMEDQEDPLSLHWGTFTVEDLEEAWEITDV